MNQLRIKWLPGSSFLHSPPSQPFYKLVRVKWLLIQTKQFLFNISGIMMIRPPFRYIKKDGNKFSRRLIGDIKAIKSNISRFYQFAYLINTAPSIIIEKKLPAPALSCIGSSSWMIEISTNLCWFIRLRSCLKITIK